jgi:hypothetical protein
MRTHDVPSFAASVAAAPDPRKEAGMNADAGRFKLPTAKNTPEAILAQWFKQIAKERPDLAKRSGQNAIDRLKLPKTQNRFKEVLDMDFAQPTSVDQLLKARAAPISKEGLLRLLDRRYAQLGVQRTTKVEPPHRRRSRCT